MSDRIRARDVIAEMKKPRRRWPYAFALFLMAIPVAALSFFWQWTTYLTIPFVFLPFFFAATMMILDPTANGTMSNRVMFSLYGAYYRPYFGVFRVVRNGLIALAWSALLGGLAMMVSYLISNAVDPEFGPAWEQFVTYYENGNVLDAVDFLTTNATLGLLTHISEITTTVVFFIVFAHKIGLYGLNLYHRSTLEAPARMANALYCKAIKDSRGDFQTDYFSATWPLYVILVALLAGGYFIAFAIQGITLYGRIGFMTGFALCLLPLSLPYYAAYLSLATKKYRFFFIDCSIRTISSELERMPVDSPDRQGLEKALAETIAMRAQAEEKIRNEDQEETK